MRKLHETACGYNHRTTGLSLCLEVRVTWALILAGFVELWPHGADNGHYQHRSGAEARAEIAVAHVLKLEPWLAWGWTGRHDAKIPSSFLNLEATRVLERRHGIDAYLDVMNVRAGFSVYRRGVDELDRVRTWGRAEIDTTHAYSIGYYDGGFPIVGYGPVSVRGPRIWEINRGTLPSYDWEISAEGEIRGLDCAGSLMLGGIRGDVPAWDLRISRQFFPGLSAGVTGGRIEPPGWGLPIYRIAALFSVEVQAR